MEIQYYGANCVRIGNKKVSVLVDDTLANVGLSSVATAEDIALFTLEKGTKNPNKFLIEGPGEYEVSEVSVRGIPAQAHLDADGHRATMYSIQMQGFSIGVIGHVHPNLSEDQLELLGLIDVLIIPVGGSGYTLDATGAASLVKKIEPKIVVPTHYADSAVKYELPQAELNTFLSEIGASEPERVDVLKLKESELGDKTRVVVIERSKK
ncbi:MAG: MBL fold metallo-hydrolase [Candidatus Saccharimonadales bacterium]